VESVNFDRAAGFYDATRALPAAVMDQMLDVLARELVGRQPCLEIGVGTGRVALPLRDRGIRLAGADISEGMLRRLLANADGAMPFPLLRADATCLPVAAGSFGSVLAIHVLHLVGNWRGAVGEAVRVLRPGGTLIASFPARGALDRPPERAAPWRRAVDDILGRHNVIRVATGAGAADEVAGHLGERAKARLLPSVRLQWTQTLARELRDIEEQVHSWTWPYPREQVLAAGAEIRAWAARENLALETPHPAEGALSWWAFDLLS
jgi:SAM-dependent methyltransferase